MSSPYSLAKPPKAPKKRLTRRPFSLDNPPRAPKKEVGVRNYSCGQISRLVLPLTPQPPPPPKKKAEKKEFNLTPIPIDWGTIRMEKEAQELAQTNCVRPKFLTYTPGMIDDLCDIPFLEKLWEMYFPSTQPRNAYEEAYLDVMRECIDLRLNVLRLNALLNL